MRYDVHLLPSALYQETVSSMCLITVESAPVCLWIFMQYWIAGPGQIKIFITIFPAALILQQRTRGRSTIPISCATLDIAQNQHNKGCFFNNLDTNRHEKIPHEGWRPEDKSYLFKITAVVQTTLQMAEDNLLPSPHKS